MRQTTTQQNKSLQKNGNCGFFESCRVSMSTDGHTEEIQDISLLRQGDHLAFERIYRLYWAKVYNFSALYLDNPPDREDVVQHVFLKVWKYRQSLDPTKSLDGFLFILTRNQIFTLARRTKKTKTFEEIFSNESDFSKETEDLLEAKDLHHYVDQLVEGLPPRQREAFLLSRRSGLSNKEIGNVMGISEKGVERHIYLALRFIRKNLPLFLTFLS